MWLQRRRSIDTEIIIATSETAIIEVTKKGAWVQRIDTPGETDMSTGDVLDRLHTLDPHPPLDEDQHPHTIPGEGRHPPTDIPNNRQHHRPEGGHGLLILGEGKLETRDRPTIEGAPLHQVDGGRVLLD